MASSDTNHPTASKVNDMRNSSRANPPRLALCVLGFSTLCATPNLLSAHPEHGDGNAPVAAIIDNVRATERQVRLRGISFRPDGTVSGTLVNRTDRLLRDVRLLVRYDWIWRDEQNPGYDSPGRSYYYTLPGDVPAEGSVPFTYVPQPLLPYRNDGRFRPSIEVSSFTPIRFKTIRRKVDR